MTEPELLDLVRAAFARIDAVPAETQRMARGAIGWLDPSAALAELTDDLLPEATGVRAGPGTRLLTFTGPGVTIESEVTAHELVGRLIPPAPARIEVRPGPQTVRADRTGHFTLPEPPPGLLSLVFHLPDSTSIVTSWVRL